MVNRDKNRIFLIGNPKMSKDEIVMFGTGSFFHRTSVKSIS